jgi:hypothetical protein
MPADEERPKAAATREEKWVAPAPPHRQATMGLMPAIV